MNNPKQPNDPAKLKPGQETGEEFGSIKSRQVDERNHPNRSDTPRGSEVETRANSRERG
jgi:hypothetical protein